MSVMILEFLYIKTNKVHRANSLTASQMFLKYKGARQCVP